MVMMLMNRTCSQQTWWGCQCPGTLQGPCLHMHPRHQQSESALACTGTLEQSAVRTQSLQELKLSNWRMLFFRFCLSQICSHFECVCVHACMCVCVDGGGGQGLIPHMRPHQRGFKGLLALMSFLQSYRRDVTPQRKASPPLCYS